MAIFTAVSVALQRAALRALAVVAPSTVDRMVVDRFATPSRDRDVRGEPIGERQMVRSGNETLAVYSAGDAPRVLLVHGWEGTAVDVVPLATMFRAAGFGVVSFDHPAHGRSTGSRVTLPQMARAVLDVGRSTGPFAAVVAHSLGASAALLALSDGLSARCAVLISPPHDARHFIRFTVRAMGLSDARVAGAIAHLERQVGAVGGDETDRVAARLRLPGLVLHDPADRYVPFAHGEAVAAAWPRARLVPLEGVGHRRMLNDASVHADILSFIRETAP